MSERGLPPSRGRETLLEWPPTDHTGRTAMPFHEGALAERDALMAKNVLGLSLGIDPFSPAVRLPLLGRLGLARSRPPLSVRPALERPDPT